MTLYILKITLSALLITLISEIAKRSGYLGGLIASLPLISVLSLTWLYHESRNPKVVAELSSGIFWFVLPSLVLFVVLSFLLKKNMAFYPALGWACLATMAAYGLMGLGLSRWGIKL